MGKRAIEEGGSSYLNMEMLIQYIERDKILGLKKISNYTVETPCNLFASYQKTKLISISTFLCVACA